jgi:3-deoxy-manno-octulosonate cytidylyltransferase (CMP-KDO synthetase)
VKKVIGVIPARFASTRFPGKPLALINGREMIAWVIEGTRKAKSLQELYVATDDQRIAEVAKREGAQVVMTDSNLPSGTDRIWAATENIDCEIVVNIQGDEPLVQGSTVDALVEPLLQDSTLEMATLAHEISQDELESSNSVKVVVDQFGRALYFSRYPIPYSRDNARHSDLSGALKHIGMYGYRKSFLKRFCSAPQAEIEKAESLEQLRALYLGAKIKVVPVQERSQGVDTMEDLKKVEVLLQNLKKSSIR